MTENDSSPKRSDWPDERVERTPLAEVPPAVLAAYMDSALEAIEYAYKLSAHGRHSEVELMPDDMFRITCWGERQTTVTWRTTANEAFEAARGWAHNGELPQSQPTLRGLQPVVLCDERAPSMQRLKLAKGAHGDVTLGELGARRG